MKKIFIYIALSLLGYGILFSQSFPSTSENYVLNKQARVAKTTATGFWSLNTTTESAETVQYFDGLGRPIQTVAVQASPGAFDVVDFVEYDALGREERKYLPYVATNSILPVQPSGSYRPLAQGQQLAFYTTSQFPNISQSDLNFSYSETVYENSPLHRVNEQGAPGADWQIDRDVNGNTTLQGHTLKNRRRPNVASDFVIDWRFDTSSGHFYGGDSYGTTNSFHTYPAGALWIDEVEDQNGHIVESFTDKFGRTVLSRALLGTAGSTSYQDYAYTYYLYNDLHQLVMILQPEGAEQSRLNSSNWVIDGDLAEQFAFQYKYDGRGRVIEKKVPGADWIHLVYNRLDQAVLTQDGNQRVKGEWSFTKYDRLKRPIMIGIYWSSTTRSTLQSEADNWTGPMGEIPTNSLIALFNNHDYQDLGYSDNAFPRIIKIPNYTLPLGYVGPTVDDPNIYNGKIHSITYYDNYDFDADGTTDHQPATSIAGITLEPAFKQITESGTSYVATGQVTGIKIRVLDPDSDMPDWLTTVTFYDAYGREIQTRSDNHLPDGSGGFNYDMVYHDYNFAGELLRTLQYHNFNLSSSSDRIILNKTYTYDHRSRLKEVKYKVNEGTEFILSAHEYNEVGQLVEKNLHSENGGANFLQSIDFAYNIQGWLTDINNIEAEMPQASCNTGGGRGGSSIVTVGNVAINFQKEPIGSGPEVLLKTSVYLNEEVQITSQNGQQVVNLINTGTLLERNSAPLNNNFTTPNMVLHDFKGIAVDSTTIGRIQATVDSLIGVATDTSGLDSMDVVNLAKISKDLLDEEWKSIFDPDDNQDLFAEHLDYNEDDGNMHQDAIAQYNGNIRSMQIRSAQACEVRRWDYSYDPLNRLTNAHNKARDGSQAGTPWTLETDYYSTKNLTYDLNGNILSLERYGKQYASGTFGKIDDLVYTYSGNQLIKVEDLFTTVAPPVNNFEDGWTTAVTLNQPLTHEYYYDDSGNMTKDRNKGLDDVTYNYLNKPTEVSRSVTETITYIYSADGTKLRQKMDDNGTTKITDYVNGFQYEDDGTTSGLQFFSHEEGRVVKNGTSFDFEYTISDHLGNGRVYFKEDPNTVGIPIEIQETHYYAFGLEISDLGYKSGSLNEFQYNKKEIQDELNLGWYDYSARMYDPTIGRFGGIDHHAENYLNWNPYNYVGNNPIVRVDPDGMDWVITLETTTDGHTTVNITFKAAVLRTGDQYDVDMVAFRDEITKQIRHAFSITGEDITTKVTPEIRIIDGVEQLNDDEHLLEVIDENSKDAFGNDAPIATDYFETGRRAGEVLRPASHTRAIVSHYAGNIKEGAKRVGTKHIYYNSRYANDMISRTRVNLGPHEVGHTGGLYHPDLDKIPYEQKIWTFDGFLYGRVKNNLMISGKAQAFFENEDPDYNSKPKQATELQMKIIIRNIKTQNTKEVNIPRPY